MVARGLSSEGGRTWRPILNSWLTKSGRSIAVPVQRHLSLGAWHGRRPAIPILEHKVMQRQFLWVWSRFTRRTSRMLVRRLIGRSVQAPCTTRATDSLRSAANRNSKTSSSQYHLGAGPRAGKAPSWRGMSEEYGPSVRPSRTTVAELPRYNISTDSRDGISTERGRACASATRPLSV